MRRLTPRWNIPYLTDIDNDGVPNREDCYPFNPHLQHIKPNIEMMKELENLPTTFMITDLSPTEEWGKRLYLLGTKEAKRYCPEAVRDIWGILKSNPHIITTIKKAKPDVTVYFSSIRDVKFLDWTGVHEIKERSIYVRKPQPLNSNKVKYKTTPVTGEAKAIIAKKQRRHSARSFFHEAYHISGPLWHRHSESKAEEFAEVMLRKRESKGKLLPPDAFEFPSVKPMPRKRKIQKWWRGW